MMKKILPLSVVVLVFILIILFAIQNMMRGGASQSNTTPIPTQYAVDGRSPRSTSGSSTQSQKQSQSTPLSQAEFRHILPILTPDFTIDYAERLDKYVVHLQTENADKAYNEWLQQNPTYADELAEHNTVIAQQSIKELNEALDFAAGTKLSPEQKAKKDAEIFTQTLNTLINFPYMLLNTFTNSSDSVEPAITPPPQTSPTSTPQSRNPRVTQPPTAPSGRGYVYYSQCSGPYDSVPLPNGCDVCDAGCGPTTIAMILSSYVDKTMTPPKVIDQLEKSGVRMGCYGSYIAELYSYLNNRGDLKVSSFIIPNEGRLQAKDVADDFRGYIKNGWTIFVLANFRTDGGGHYFWVTDVTDDDEILAYDPYYGRSQPAPFNENKYSPAPYYRYAFAIKKST